MKPRIFVSYSHADASWLERLRVHLKPLTRQGHLDLWDDTRLRGGDDWRTEIRKALEDADVAILLISADFLASDFVVTEELPSILHAASQRGAKVLPLIVAPSMFAQYPELSRFQALNDPKFPLSSLDPSKVEETFLRLAMTLHEHVATPKLVLSAGDNQPTKSQKIMPLVQQLQSRTTALSSLLTDILMLAEEEQNQRLAALCRNELVGYRGQGGPKQTEELEDCEHRTLQFLASPQEVNIDFFGSGANAMQWMKEQPGEFTPLKVLFPEPLSKVERHLARSTPDRLLCLSMPAGSLMPTTEIPDMKVFLYADGDMLHGLVENLRTKLTTMLLNI